MNIFDGAKTIAVLWEVTMDTNPPAMIRPLKPKLWRTASASLEPKQLYRVL